MLNRKGYETFNGGIMSNQFGAYIFRDLLPTKEREAPEPIPENPATDSALKALDA